MVVMFNEWRDAQVGVRPTRLNVRSGEQAVVETSERRAFAGLKNGVDVRFGDSAKDVVDEPSDNCSASKYI